MANPPKTQESMSFGRTVRMLRKKAKITQDELADRLNVVRSYISQVETGAAQCREDFAERLDKALDANGEVQRAWKEFIEPLHEEKFPRFFANFPRAEQSAVAIRAYEAGLVYGLLQTKEYANVLLPNEQDLANRMARQAVLASPSPPLICVVLSEAVLCNMVGSPQIMQQQLEDLIEKSYRDYIHIQIAPFGYYRGVWGPFHIATQVNRSEVAYGASAFGGETTSDPARITQVSNAFATLQAQALNEADSRERMRRVISEKWT
ncbi:helix-turn-helix domain-containing protein [Spirillospora sp. NPDC050679]